MSCHGTCQLCYGKPSVLFDCGHGRLPILKQIQLKSLEESEDEGTVHNCSENSDVNGRHSDRNGGAYDVGSLDSIGHAIGEGEADDASAANKVDHGDDLDNSHSQESASDPDHEGDTDGLEDDVHEDHDHDTEGSGTDCLAFGE